MKKIVTLIVFVTICAILSAQTLPYSLVNTDAQSTAGISVLANDSAYSAENNPAAMSLYDGIGTAALSYGIWQPQANNASLIGFSSAFRIGRRLGLGLYAKFATGSEYNVINDSGVPSQVNGQFTPKDMAIGLSTSYKIAEGLSAGLSFRYYNSTLTQEIKTSAVSFDLGAAYNKDALSLGLAVSNLGPKVKVEDSEYAQSSLIKAGVGYEIIKGLKAGLQADYFFAGGLNAHLGASYEIAEIVELRAGYCYGTKDSYIPSYATVGLGAEYAGIALNFSYFLASSTLSGSMLFGLGYSF